MYRGHDRWLQHDQQCVGAVLERSKTWAMRSRHADVPWPLESRPNTVITMKTCPPVTGFSNAMTAKMVPLCAGFLLGVSANTAALAVSETAPNCAAALTAIADVRTGTLLSISQPVLATSVAASALGGGATTIQDVLTRQALPVRASPAAPVGTSAPFNLQIAVSTVIPATALTVSSVVQIMDVRSGAALSIAPSSGTTPTAATPSATTILDVITRAPLALAPGSIPTTCVAPPTI